MMRVPLVYTASEIVNWHVAEEYEQGKWRPSRPCGFCSLSWDHLKMRFRTAWRVFIGEHDALNWQGTGKFRATEINYRDCLHPRWKNACDQEK
jgi:hypothetical protein